jgi:hypothetical protein
MWGLLLYCPPSSENGVSCRQSYYHGEDTWAIGANIALPPIRLRLLRGKHREVIQKIGGRS